jgi:hypothetical protein
MKTRSTSNLGLVAMAFLLATAVTASAADLSALTKAKVVRIKGSARYTTGSGNWQPLKVGDVLDQGTVVQTAADSRVDLVLGDTEARAVEARASMVFGAASPGATSAGGGVGAQVDQNFIRMMENTVLSIDNLMASETGDEIVTETQLDLRSGRIFATVKKLSAGSKYEVKIPNGVAGVRGTILIVDASGFAQVLDGMVALALSVGDEVRTKLIKANQQYDPRTDVLSSLGDNEKREMTRLMRGPAHTKPGPPPPGWTKPPHNPNKPHLPPTMSPDD